MQKKNQTYLEESLLLHAELTELNQVVQRGTKICPRFWSKSICAGNLNLKNYLISSLNYNCKRKKTPENGYVDSSRLV